MCTIDISTLFDISDYFSACVGLCARQHLPKIDALACSDFPTFQGLDCTFQSTIMSPFTAGTENTQNNKCIGRSQAHRTARP